jgi:chromosome segregation ATPase
MSNATETADFIRRQARLFEGFVRVADELDRIGSIENAAKEAAAARETAELAVNVARSTLAALEAQIAESKDAAAEILLAADKTARQRADDMAMQTRAELDAIIDSAVAKAESMAIASQAERALVLAELGALREQSATMRDDAGTWEATVKALQKEHDRLTRAIDKLKAQFA